MKDFDVERKRRLAAPRQFTIAGQTFTRVAGAKPETLLAWAELRGVNSDDGPADGEAAIRLMDRLMHDLLVPDDRARWAELRALDGEDALTIQDISDVLSWVVAGVMGRPLEPSSSSPDSSTTTPSEAASMPASSSPGTGEAPTT